MTSTATATAMSGDRPIPSVEQLAWADAEVGVIIHLDVQVFAPDYTFRRDWGRQPSATVFNPSHLDTDQWLEVAASSGARYAVLVAKHCSGFSLWPTAAHGYSVRSAPWRGGAGDVVADFVASCKKFGLKAGLYYSTSCNAFCNVDSPGRERSGLADAQAAYNRVVEQQVSELWTRYGEWFELWFDGGVLSVMDGGCDVAGLLARHQPRALLFQGPPECGNLLRWAGNEAGWAPPECWSTTDVLTAEDGTVSRDDLAGAADGRHWAPAEMDMPNRDQSRGYMDGWFWREGEDQLVMDAETLFARHLTSVGRNANFLLGLPIDRFGRVPEADAAALRGYGKLVGERLGRPLGMVAEVTGNEVVLDLQGDRPVAYVDIMEDQRNGQIIRGWRLDAKRGWGWAPIASGLGIGHRRIVATPHLLAESLRLTVTSAAGIPTIRQLAAYGPV